MTEYNKTLDIEINDDSLDKYNIPIKTRAKINIAKINESMNFHELKNIIFPEYNENYYLIFFAINKNVGQKLVFSHKCNYVTGKNHNVINIIKSNIVNKQLDISNLNNYEYNVIVGEISGN